MWTRCGRVAALMTFTFIVLSLPTSNPANLAVLGSMSMYPLLPMFSNLSLRREMIRNHGNLGL